MNELARFTLRLARIQTPAFDFDKASVALIKGRVLTPRPPSSPANGACGRHASGEGSDNASCEAPLHCDRSGKLQTLSSAFDSGRTVPAVIDGLGSEWRDPWVYRCNRQALSLAA